VKLSRRDRQVSRRAIVTGAFGMLAAGKGPSAAAAPQADIEYHGGSLYWPSGQARAAVGAGGVRPNKKEGDKATPAGKFLLPFGMYRRDRIKLPTTDLPMTPLRAAHAWVDDPSGAAGCRQRHFSPYRSARLLSHGWMRGGQP